MKPGVPVTSAGRCITDAHNELRQVREWLLQPATDTMEACPAALARAATYVHDLSAQINPSHPNSELLQPLVALSKEIRAAQRLLHAAASLHFGRLRRITDPDA